MLFFISSWPFWFVSCPLFDGQNHTLGSIGDTDEWSDLYRSYPYVLYSHLRTDSSLCAADGGQVMNVLYVVTGIITLVLLVYLVLALLKPEWFGWISLAGFNLFFISWLCGPSRNWLARLWQKSIRGNTPFWIVCWIPWNVLFTASLVSSLKRRWTGRCMPLLQWCSTSWGCWLYMA